MKHWLKGLCLHFMLCYAEDIQFYSAICSFEGRGGVTAPVFLKLQESLSKSRPCCENVCHSVIIDLFFYYQ